MRSTVIKGRKANMKGFSIGRDNRITKSSDYQYLAKHGRRIQNQNFIIVYAESRRGRSRLGITVSKKVGKAVVRNRIKRLVREYFRLNRHRLAGHYDLNCIAKPSAGQLHRRDVTQTLEAIFSQIPE